MWITKRAEIPILCGDYLVNLFLMYILKHDALAYFAGFQRAVNKIMSTIMLFLDLPSDYLTHLFSEWLDMKDLGTLDSGFTHCQRRESFLRELSRSEVVCSGRVDLAEDDALAANTRNIYYRWLTRRNIKVKILEIGLDTTIMSILSSIMDQNADHLETLIFLFNPKTFSDYGRMFSRLLKLRHVYFGKMKVALYTTLFNSFSFPEKMIALDFHSVDGLTAKELSIASSVCRNLQKLSLSRCNSLLVEGVDGLDFQFDLRRFRICDCDNVSDNLIKCLLSKCYQLKNLDFESVDISDITLQFVSERALCLENLAIIDSSLLCSSDEAAKLIDRCPVLDTLELQCRGDFCDILWNAAKRCLKLARLRLYDSCGVYINNGVMMDYLAKAPQLTEVRLINSRLMTDGFVYALAAHCHLIQVVDCRSSTFCNESLTHLVKTCTKLKALYINGCRHLNDATLVEILSEGKRLNRLSFWVKQISASALACVETHSPSMESMTLMYDDSIILSCRQRLGKTINHLRTIRPNLKIEFAFI